MDRWVRPEDERRKVMVPLEPAYEDFAERILDLVRDLSLAEERPPESVLRDQLAARADTVASRSSPAAARTTPPSRWTMVWPW
jgi:hypothetical protein